MSQETVTLKRTITHTDDQGNEISEPTVIETSFDVTWPEARDESYDAFFEDEAARWQNELRGLQSKIKSAAGAYITTNETADGLQEYMDAYKISVRTHGGGRRKEVQVTAEALETAGVSMEQMQRLAESLGLKITNPDD
jgi:hypothetical protein